MGNNKDKLIERLQGIIDTEHTMSFCCRQLASLIKNGKVRKQFNSFSDIAEKNKRLLKETLHNFGINNFVLEQSCQYCKIKTESFSLIGTIELGLEITNIAIKYYKELLDLCADSEDKKTFSLLLKEKIKQRDFLKKEKGFKRLEEERSGLIRNYCISEVISNLWR